LKLYCPSKNGTRESQSSLDLSFRYHQKGSYDRAMEFAEQALADSNWNRYHLVRRIRISDGGDLVSDREKDKSVENYLKSLKHLKESAVKKV